MSNNIGEKMKNLRLNRKMSQNDVAEAMGISRQYVSRWESGERNINADQLVQYAKLMGVTLDYFNDNTPQHTLFQAMAQLEDAFTSANIPEVDKDKAYQDIMKIYLRSKELASSTRKNNAVEEVRLDAKEE